MLSGIPSCTLIKGPLFLRIMTNTWATGPHFCVFPSCIGLALPEREGCLSWAPRIEKHRGVAVSLQGMGLPNMTLPGRSDTLSPESV